MVDLKSLYIESLSTNINTSEPNYVQPDKQDSTAIIIFGVIAIVLIAIILVSYCTWYRFCLSTKQKNKQRSILSRHVSSLYASPIRGNTISESIPVSAIYIVPVRSNTIVDVVEELPPSYYYSVDELPERQLEPITRL